VHGHNWTFVFTFEAEKTDVNNFVFDFGKLKDLKHELCKLDHALVIAQNDPEIETFNALEADQLCKLVLLPSTSSEGIAEYYHIIANSIVKQNSNGRVKCISCKVIEDDNNSAEHKE
jgi:6-pyruvoyltetrahydropterin/6-carboxytetrahydropterin synthase